MFIKLVKAKIHLATVTEKNLYYEGSITLPSEVLEKAGIRPFEAVWVYNLNNGERFETYVIEGEKGKVILNGPAARLGEVGDKLIIVAFAWINDQEIPHFRTRLIYLDEKNEISASKVK